MNDVCPLCKFPILHEKIFIRTRDNNRHGYFTNWVNVWKNDNSFSFSRYNLDVGIINWHNISLESFLGFWNLSLFNMLICYAEVDFVISTNCNSRTTVSNATWNDLKSVCTPVALDLSVTKSTLDIRTISILYTKKIRNSVNSVFF